MIAPLIVPKGWKLVPEKLTEDMAAAMEFEFSTEGQWAAALAAAPSCPATGMPIEEEIIEAMEPFYIYDKAAGSRFFNMEEAARAILKLLTEKGEKPNG